MIKERNIAFVMSLDVFIRDLAQIKIRQLNVISIRDPDRHSSVLNRGKYRLIDESGFENLMIVHFDDVEKNHLFENLDHPSKDQIGKVLIWAKQKWEENGKFFIKSTVLAE